MHVDGNASPSLPLNSSTLTTNNISCGAISCTGSITKPTLPTVVGVHIGLDTAAARGIEILASRAQYTDFTIINSDYKGMMAYSRSGARFNWYIHGLTGLGMKLT